MEKKHVPDIVGSIVMNEYNLSFDHRHISIMHHVMCSKHNVANNEYERVEYKDTFILVEYVDISGNWICNKILSNGKVEKFDEHPSKINSNIKRKIFGPMEYEVGKVPMYYSTTCVAKLGHTEVTRFLFDMNNDELQKHHAIASPESNRSDNIKHIIRIYNLASSCPEMSLWIERDFGEIVQHKFTRVQILTLTGDDKIKDMQEYQRYIADILQQENSGMLQKLENNTLPKIHTELSTVQSDVSILQDEVKRLDPPPAYARCAIAEIGDLTVDSINAYFASGNHGINDMIADSGNATILHYACSIGNVEVTRALLLYNPDINIRRLDTGKTPLHEAVSRNHADILQILLECAGILIDIADNEGHNAAHYDTASGPEISNLLSGFDSMIGDSIEHEL